MTRAPLSPTALAILRATSETEPRTSAAIRVHAGIDVTRRAVVSHTLGELRERGLVTSKDFSTLWLRTQAGTVEAEAT